MKHIIHIITGLQRGGAETVLVTLATALSKEPYCYRQSVLYFNDGVMRDSLERLGITCYKVSYISAWWYLKKLKPHLIHSSLWSAGCVARLYGRLLSVPVYCALHNLAEHSGVFRNTIDKLFPFQPTGYIAVSQEVKKSHLSFIPAEKITVIENGIPERTDRAFIRRHQQTYTIGAVGRFVPVKNYHILLEAFALLHKKYTHTRLILVGHGPLEHMLRDQAEKLGLSHAVRFVINKPAQELYAEFDCFVQPSHSEGFSLTAAEALQAHVPVIVTGNNNKHIFIKHNQHGLVIEPDSVPKLYNALAWYREHPDAAHAHAQAGADYVEKHFSARKMAQAYDALFNGV